MDHRSVSEPNPARDALVDAILAEVAGLQAAALDIEAIADRYGIGKTRAYELVKEAWFPAPVLTSPMRWAAHAVVAAERLRSERGPNRAGRRR